MTMRMMMMVMMMMMTVITGAHFTRSDFQRGSVKQKKNK